MSQLICYDIAENSLRARLGAKIMETGFERINKSVYLGTVDDADLMALENWLVQRIQNSGGPGDSLIILPVTPAQVQRMRVYGNDNLDKDDLSGQKNTLII